MEDTPVSSPPAPEAFSREMEHPPLKEPLQYEETPLIPDMSKPELPNPLDHPELPARTPRKQGSFMGFVGNLLLLVILFAGGVWLSTVIRPYLPSDMGSLPIIGTKIPVVTPPVVPTAPPDPFASWKTYQVISAATKQPIEGIQFKLPPETLALLCDGTGCNSQGTYLPGGTRFTVAPRGKGQLLTDFRGKTITDVAGQAFTVKEATVAGHSALEFVGAFTGTTVGGYAFSQMRGMMIEVNDILSLEVNHFTPAGVAADFVSDDSLFDTILTTFEFENASDKGAMVPTTSPVASPSSAP